MANGTNASAPYYSYEYYLDYLDLIPVDEKKLKAHKHSIVIAFWVSLAAFVVLLFLILLYMSWSGSLQMRGTCNATGPPQGTSQAPASSVEDPGSRAGPDQWPQQESPSASPPRDPQAKPTLL
uniref:Melanocortin 2 receptor accessory protein n=1 Tax=Prolemur simus TaxID=1328070 RepID=A0A8C8ZBM5_PROSS